MPSFFEFQISKNEKKLFKPNHDYKYFSVFCGSSQKCKFKFSELEGDAQKTSNMITLTVSTLGTFSIFVMIIGCYYIINCCKKKKEKKNTFNKTLEKSAPKVLFHEDFSAETCSICSATRARGLLRETRCFLYQYATPPRCRGRVCRFR